MTWGELVSLEYGRSLRNYSAAQGAVRVYGSNGPIGWTDAAPLGSGPGVILGRKGAYRGVEYSRGPFFVIDTAYFLQPRVPVDMRWLYFAVRAAKLGEIDDGSPIPSTTRSAVYVQDAKVPPLAEQRAIARILGALDDKIELNRQMNETLEALARALFQSWFVDFDPVRAKMRGEQPVGMDAATAALFPSRLVQTEHGEVPEGWTTREIGQAVTVVGGSTPSTERADFWDGPHAWVRPKDLSNLSTPVLLNTERTITDAGLATISSKLLPINSVLLSSRAPIGYLAINRMPVAINQGFIGMVCDGPLPPSYVLRWTESQLETIKGRAGGTTFPEISKGAFRPLPVLVPSSGAVNAFERRAAPLMERVAANEVESKTLAATRDLLLPRLLSGELRVPDAERLVAEAV
jgi:type I restriction enzyme S subunit